MRILTADGVRPRRRVMFLSAAILLWVNGWPAWAGTPVTTQQPEIVSAPRFPFAQPLLFGFATSGFGFDTEIAISNTSQDNFGSPAQAGACTLDFYGPGAPPRQTTRVIPPGGAIAFTLLEGGGGVAPAPSFQGYIIAKCGFPLARGVATLFGSDLLGTAQDAQVLTLPRSTSSPQRLLFPFISSQGGLDSGIAIANTGADPFGTPGTPGSCTVSFYGPFAPAGHTTATIPPGYSATLLSSAMAPGFQGYAIADCDFPGASGFAFVADMGARSFMFSETAELLSLPRSRAVRPLLFSAVTNQGGLDSEIAIANTTLNQFEPTGPAGPCTLNFYGANAPAAPFLTPSIGPGTVYTNWISAMAPGFTGYIFSSCEFPLARGWALTNWAGFSSDGDSLTAEIVAQPRSTTPAPLLFSHVSNWNGQDTEITIKNTTQDPFGTSAAGGACTLSYYGDMVDGSSPPAPQLSTVIPAGARLAFTLSQGNLAQGIAATPGFRGYIIAECAFPLARGLSSITGVPAGDTVAVTLDSAPAGLSLTVDGTAYTAPHTFTWLAGSNHTIAAGTQGAGGTRYVFADWSHGGSASQSITVPSHNTTYSAEFTTEYLLTTNVSPAAGGTVSGGGWFGAGTKVSVAATANSGYQFAYFSGALSGSGNPQDVTMSGPRAVVANFATLAPVLTASISTRSGTGAERQWTLKLTNNGLGGANGAQFTGVSVTQTGGAACSPAIISPTPAPSAASPLPVGNLAPGGSGTAAITVNFSGCVPAARFRVALRFSANSGSYTGLTTLNNQFY